MEIRTIFRFIFLLLFFSGVLTLTNFYTSKARANEVSHRIGTRMNQDGYGEFYDKVTNESFIPRGNNYIRLDAVDGYHNLFNPGNYDVSRVEAALNKMQQNGYNTVRVFLDWRAIGGDLASPGVNPIYMNNLVDFLSRARFHNLHVIITREWVPSNYFSIVRSMPPTTGAEEGGVNTMMLSNRWIIAYKTYLSDTIAYIKNNHPELLPTVFVWDLWNEGIFVSNIEPFSLTTGSFNAVEGGTYNLADSSSRQLLADNSAKYWANQMAAAIKDNDPEALTEVSLFTPKGAGKDGFDGVAPHPDPRSPFRPSALYESNVDLIDIHQYPLGPTYNLSQDLASAEINLLGREKPRTVSEFGALKNFYPTLTEAATTLHNHLAANCEFGFRGGIAWTWDTTELTAYWTVLAGNEDINQALAPRYYPDPCATSTSPSPPTSLTINKSVDKNQAQAGETLAYNLAYTNPTSNTYESARIEDQLPSGTDYVEGSASGGGVYDPVTRTITWNLSSINPSDSGSYSFQVVILSASPS